MFFKKIAMSAIIVSACCNIAYATVVYPSIKVTNNTDSFGTGFVNKSGCSNQIGDSGIAKPHSTLSIPSIAFDLFCISSGCKAHVFLNKNCGGTELAVVDIDSSKGVTNIVNYDSEHYTISGTGKNLSLDPITHGWKSWFKWF